MPTFSVSRLPRHPRRNLVEEFIMSAGRLKASLSPEEITAVIDTREQSPFDLSPLRSVRRTLATGDYSVKGLEHVIAIERKSLGDLLQCVAQQRGRFEREVHRLLAYPVRALVIESTWAELEAGQWRSKAAPSAVIGSCLGWVAAGLPVLMAGDHEQAGRFVARLLLIAARRRWRETRSFVAAALNAGAASALVGSGM